MFLLSQPKAPIYRTHFNSYMRFCNFMGDSPFPATCLAICQYAASLARSLKFSSVKNYLNTIGLLHKEFGLNNPLTDNSVINSLLMGIKRVKSDSAKQKLPITADILKGIFNLLNINNGYDASFWAICLVAFFGLFQKSHLLPVSGKLYDPNKQFSRSSFLFYSSGALIKVKWSKTIQFRDRVVSIPLPSIPGSPLCPVRASLTTCYVFHSVQPF